MSCFDSLHRNIYSFVVFITKLSIFGVNWPFPSGGTGTFFGKEQWDPSRQLCGATSQDRSLAGLVTVAISSFAAEITAVHM